MADREKVIKGLETCIPMKYETDEEKECRHEQCPYRRENYKPMNGCFWDLMSDALAILKEQEAEIERLTKTEEQKQAERKQKRREWQAKYRESHRKQAYQIVKEWRRNNPDKWKAQQARYREKQRQKRKEGDEK